MILNNIIVAIESVNKFKQIILQSNLGLGEIDRVVELLIIVANVSDTLQQSIFRTNYNPTGEDKKNTFYFL
jgi:hypothetical protein